MSVQEFYESIGVNYTDVLRRLGSEKFIEKYLKKMLDDGNYDILRQAVEKGDFPEAFRASHTLKGICLNLGLSTALSSNATISTPPVNPGEKETLSENEIFILPNIPSRHQERL